MTPAHQQDGSVAAHSVVQLSVGQRAGRRLQRKEMIFQRDKVAVLRTSQATSMSKCPTRLLQPYQVEYARNVHCNASFQGFRSQLLQDDTRCRGQKVDLIRLYCQHSQPSRLAIKVTHHGHPSRTPITVSHCCAYCTTWFGRLYRRLSRCSLGRYAARFLPLAGTSRPLGRLDGAQP